MNSRSYAGFALLAALVAVLGFGFRPGWAEDIPVPRMTLEELKGRLGQPGLTIIDVRAATDWRSSGVKIPGAVREDPYNAEVWADRYAPESQIVLYCA